MTDYDELVELISKTATEARAIVDAAQRFAGQIDYFGKLDLNSAVVAADIKAVNSTTESLAHQMAALDVAGVFLTQLGDYHIGEGSGQLAAEVDGALKGEGVFLYADGTLPQVARFAASVHGLLVEQPLDSSLAESNYRRGSLIGFLFRGNREASARVAGRAKDALVGKTSAEMTHEEVRAYREFVEATHVVPSAILITERYAFAKVTAGVFAFHLDTTRKAMLRQETALALSVESLVKRMLDLRQPGDVELSEHSQPAIDLETPRGPLPSRTGPLAEHIALDE